MLLQDWGVNHSTICKRPFL